MSTVERHTGIELRRYATDEPSSHLPSRTLAHKPDISLHKAARDGHIAEVRVLLMDMAKSEINCWDKKGYTAFHYATKYNHLEIMRILVENGADPTLRTPGACYTALHLAAQPNHKPGEPESYTNKETVKFLVEDLHLDINDEGDLRKTYPLHIACSRGNNAAVEVLLDQENIKMDLRDFDNDSILHKACTTRNVDMLELLLWKLKEKGQLFDILTSKNHKGHTPLHVALYCGNPMMATKLLEFTRNDEYARTDEYSKIDPLLLLGCSRRKESDVTEFLKLLDLKLLSCRDDGATILHLVSERGCAKAARGIICKEPSLINEKDIYHRTPLHYAAANKRLEIIDLLMNQESTDVDAIDKDGYSPLLMAARQGCADTFTKLLEKADLTVREFHGKNALFLAAQFNHNAILTAAKKKDSGLFRQVDRQENTPLHAAAVHGSRNILKTLLDQRVNVNAPNYIKRTPLHVAAENGHNGFVNMLLEYDQCPGTDTDENSHTVDTFAEDEDSNTALHLAASKGHCSVAITLLNKGADVMARNNMLLTPLHCAAHGGYQEVVELLIFKHRAEVGAKDHSQETPLHLASKQGHLCVVKTLLRHTTDLKAVNEAGMNALELAIENGHSDVAMEIVKHNQWRDAMRHTYKQPQTTPMRRLIRMMPGVALEVLNRCTDTYNSPDDKEYHVTFDYEFLEDFSEPDSAYHTARSVEGGNNSLHRHKLLYLQPSYIVNRLSQRFSKWKKEGQYTNWGPAGYDKANYPLNIMVENKQTELLVHPLVSSLIQYKWSKAWLLYLTNVLFYVAFLSFLTSFALLLPNPHSALCRSVYNHTFGNASNSTECFNSSEAASYECGQCSSRQTFLYCAGGIVLFFVVIRVIMEFFQILEQPGYYFRNSENWLELFLYSFTLIFMSTLGRTCVCPEPWQWQIGALSVFLAWIHLSIFIRKLPQLGLYIIMFEDIVKTFVKIAIPTLLLVLAFSMAFYMTFFVPSPLFTASPFATLGLSIIKAMTMTVGEMDFESIFHLTSGGVRDIDDVPTPIPYSRVSILLWIFFLILLPILLMNLLTGLAVGDVEKIQSNAEYRKLALQLELVLKMEDFQAFRKWSVKVGHTMYPNRRTSLYKRLISVGVDVNFKKDIEIQHVHKQTTTLLAEIDKQRTQMAALRTEQRTEMAELRTELRMIHKNNRRMEKLLEFWARREAIDTLELDEKEVPP